jgi:hypothetical protein
MPTPPVGFEFHSKFSQVNEQYGQICKAIRKKLTEYPEVDTWYLKLLMVLATEILSNCRELSKAHTEDTISRGAWATRNLLELQVWGRYVLRSMEDARRFYEDAICDVDTLLKSFEKSSGLAADDAKQAIQRSREMLNPDTWDLLEQVTQEDTYLSVAKIAQDLGDGAGFGVLNRFLSKLVHPTSFYLQSRLNKYTTENWFAALFDVAAGLMDAALPTLLAKLRELTETS